MRRRTVAALVLSGAAALTVPAVAFAQQEDGAPSDDCRMVLVSPNPEDPYDSSGGWKAENC